ncbi:MAG: PilN domain-containing protein [Planctomycetota bacterium]|nr:MAG: PilN domain-containing protein [Planctomycetota bacterium]
MLNINFVPDDYIQSNESRRTNLMYLVLFVIVMAALGGSFVTIKIRQQALNSKEETLSAKMAKAKEAIKQFEELQTKRKVMIKAALTTAELLEPVPRSVLLASLTNNLPTGVSLLHLNFIQKEPKRINQTRVTNNYQAAQAKNATAGQLKIPREKLLETYIDIEGIAPTDLQVAAYIEQLSSSTLLDNVALVESIEYEVEDTKFRRFKLTTTLRKEIHLTKDDIKNIRTKGKESAHNF